MKSYSKNPLIIEFIKGLKGRNMGLPTGLNIYDKITGGITQETYTAILGGSGTGKTTLMNYAYIITPYLLMRNNLMPDSLKEVKPKWIYFSFEISKIKMQFLFCAFFIVYDYPSEEFFKINGETFPMSARYLRGELLDKDNNLITVSKKHQKMFKEIFLKYIVELFCSDNPLIIVYDEPETPIGVYNRILDFAETNGRLIKKKYRNRQGEEKTRLVGFSPRNKNFRLIILMDHIRKCKKSASSNKGVIDDMSDLFVKARKFLKASIITIVHNNRDYLSVQNLKFRKDEIFVPASSVKDSGNIYEDVDIMYSLMNPNDPELKLQTHMGVQIRDKGKILNKNHRTISLLKARYGDFPYHWGFNLYGAYGLIKEKKLRPK